MTHVLAALGLAVACVVWYLVQRWSGAGPRAACGRAGRDCDACDLDAPECPDPPSGSPSAR